MAEPSSQLPSKVNDPPTDYFAKSKKALILASSLPKKQTVSPIGAWTLGRTVNKGEDNQFTHLFFEEKVKMNQMQNLLHEALIATGHVENGAIIRRKDISLRASSAGFSLTNDQMERFVTAFRDPPRTREEGLFFNDRKYQCVRADTSSIYAKHEKIGVVLVKTGSLIVVGTYNDNMYPSVCVEAVEKLASYFKEKDK